ncbi:family 20 glycosylhydrolase [Bacteroidales bacterium OttesenSCG-928-B11]|nr:family 20 glycosylhydrolase [Bacteroidales bacterium OttesenSCG-928-E04]MDL2309357.1 family 20 glycosylhydrolase [Bacteroidales bacterium OttesenSCG-928-C03]MDL2313127.1 family 20 glycosylhydrolase [Bacteroidales bacterium OttesenSCG-928-B11]
MKKIIPSFLMAVLFTALLVSCKNDPVAVESYNEGINITPTPLRLEEKEGAFVLNNKTAFYAATPELQKVADFFMAKMKRSTGYDLKSVNDEGKATIKLLVDENLALNDEGYTLEVTPEQVVVKSKTPQGAFYGMQSFMQLLPAEIENLTKITANWQAPAVSIEDEPRFGYRGMHLDPCRHFIPVEDVKKYIDMMALFKLNTLHWHLTDDQGWRIEIKKYPLLIEKGATRIEGEGFEYKGHYTQEQAKDIVAYAAEQFIRVIPEIELPGHALAAISGYNNLSCSGNFETPRIQWGVEEVIFCAGKEEVFEFLEDVIKEVVEIFPSEYIHIGGDEAPKLHWEACPLCQKRIKDENLVAQDGHSAEARLQSYFVQRMEDVVAKYGKKIIGWDEILEGGIKPTATIMSWRGESGGIAAANMGHDVIMTPNSAGLYIDHHQGDYKIEPVSIGGYSTPEKIYAYDPIPEELVENGKAHHILGPQCNTWAEYMYTEDIREYRIFPRMIALAEVAWSTPDRKDFEDFNRRLNNAYVRLDSRNINYHIPQPEQPNGSCNFVAFTDKAVLEFTTSRPIKVVYTVDGTDPNPNSTEYTEPLEFTENTTLKIRSVLPSGKMSKVRNITVEKQVLAPAVVVENPTSGLKTTVIPGMYLDVDQLAKSDSAQTEMVIPALRELTRVNPSSESMRGVRQYAATATGYIDIPEDGVYYLSSDNEEVWIDGKLMINNRGEVKRFSRHDTSVALEKGLHEIKVVFLGHIIGGWPSNWNDGGVSYRHADSTKFVQTTPEMIFH